MAAQPNIDGALCESSVIPLFVPRHKDWLTAAARLPCSKSQIITLVGSKLVADRFEAGTKLVADLQRAEIWGII